MPTLVTLIINEMKSNLGHEPTKQELDSLSAYIADKNIRFLVDLELAIMDWKSFSTKECQWCGDRYLESEMICTDSGQFFCCDQCLKDYQEEHGVQ